MQNPKIAIIGGSGLYEMEGMEVQERREVLTPFGEPSCEFVLGLLNGVPVAFLARHGVGHRLLPSEINYRANIYAIKALGCEFVLSVSAVGSLKAEIEPGHLVVVDQFIDRTQGRPSSFFGDGLVAHVAFADPTCSVLRQSLAAAALAERAIVHGQGSYVCIEGPMFSTRAESELYRSWGADVIGMTNLQEAKLAREAELCYSSLALSTDYDCWHAEHAAVSAEMILTTLKANIELAQRVLKRLMPAIARERSCICSRALRHALMTQSSAVPPATYERLALILGKNYPHA